ncbi:hypothetical protein PC122_g22171 [Phytophthora cactorum]|nr:hypothetical protein PC122_g22171 [Phytophthora cactorum]
MANKRSKNEETSDAKRPKVEDGGYELALGGGVYIDMDKLFKCPALKAYFNKKYKRSVAQLIKQEKFCVIYATKNGIAEGVLHMKTVYAPKSDARLVKKGENVERIIMLAKSSSLDLAPPVITDEDLSFFVDKAGTRHHVEMRGMRTMEGIFFKAKDVGLVFKSDGFLDTVQRQHTAYSESVDYIWFTLLNPNGNSRVQWVITQSKLVFPARVTYQRNSLTRVENCSSHSEAPCTRSTARERRWQPSFANGSTRKCSRSRTERPRRSGRW